MTRTVRKKKARRNPRGMSHMKYRLDRAEGFAEQERQTEKPDEGTLREFTTAPKSLTRVMRDSNARLGVMLDTYMDGPPQEELQQVSAARSTSSAHGFFSIAGDRYFNLMDEMVRKDQTLAAALRLVVSMLLRRDVKFTVDDKSDRAAEMRDEIEKRLTSVSSRMSWGKLLWSLLHGSLQHGVSVNEIVWEPDGALDVPRAYIHRHPGMFVFDSMGDAYFYDASGDPPKVPLYKFAILENPALYGNPWGQPVIETLQFLYEFKRQILKDWLHFLTKYGLPLLMATAKSDRQFKEHQQYLENLFANLRAESAVTLPPGFEIEAIQRGAGQTGNLHREFIRYTDECMVLLLYGPILGMLDSEHNARAATQSHSGITQIALKPLGKRLGETLTRDVVKPFQLLNYGSDSPEVKAEIDTEDAIDVKQMIASVDAFHKWNLSVPESYVRSTLDMPKPTDDDAIPPPPKLTGPRLPLEINTNDALLGGGARARSFRGVDYTQADRDRNRIEAGASGGGLN